MDMPDRDTLQSLGRREGWPSISIYMPTHRAGQDKQQDRVRFRGLLTSVSDQLKSVGTRTPDVEAILGDAHGLLEDEAFWRETGAGLAVFISDEQTNAFRVDTDLPELAIANDRFVLRHLLPSMHAQDHFWLLALSKNARKLFSGDHLGLKEVALRDTPTDFKDAMRFEDADHSFRFRSESGGSPQGGSVFYGMGGLPDAEKEQVWRYVHMVERGATDAMRDSQDPLLVAGVEYIVSAYRAQNCYQHLADTALLGNPDELSLSRLHAEALKALQPSLESKQNAAIADLESRAGSAVVSDDLREIVPAAHDGRVRVLFLTQSESTWGKYDATERRVVSMRPQRTPGDQDLADLAAIETILHGGDVHVLPTAQLLLEHSGVEPPAAIMRY